MSRTYEIARNIDRTKKNIDNDMRFGCLAYGVMSKKTTEP